MESKVYKALGANGALAEHIENYAVRAGQGEMAVLIEKALVDNQVVVIEAGTGIGKTFAYLVPAMYSGLKVIISTGTKTLQEQLYYRDLPLVKKALGLPAKLALLKGRANYLCRERSSHARNVGANLHPYIVHELEEIYDWSQRTKTGDIAELNQLSDKSPVWPLVTSTVDNCLGLQCSEYDDCFLVKARREAQSADILIVNHHLLMADLMLKEGGFGELLPTADAFIVDEAHQLPEIASVFFGQSISSKQIQELIEDCDAEIKVQQFAIDQYVANKQGLQSDKLANHTDSELIVNLRKQLAVHLQVLPRNQGRYLCSRLAQSEAIIRSVNTLIDGFEQLRQWFADSPELSKHSEQCKARCENLLLRLELLCNSGFTHKNQQAIETDELQTANTTVAWLERLANGFTWHLSPMDVASEFQQKTDDYQCSWIYTSATLAVADSFSHFNQRLGISPGQELRLESPFNYQEQAMLYLPEPMPEPNSSGFTAAVVQIVLSLLRVCTGGMFVLFTSHKALAEAAKSLQPHLSRPLLVQGSAPRSDLLNRFQQSGQAVLLGTSSFWQGVDVRGQALSCVVIDKLPFSAPSDPLVEAKVAHYRANGLNPFMQFQLPEAVITLKQGVGRLIRDYNDFGLLVICDPRLHNKPYGKTFLKSLPTMPIVKDLEQAIEFLQSLGLDNKGQLL